MILWEAQRRQIVQGMGSAGVWSGAVEVRRCSKTSRDANGEARSIILCLCLRKAISKWQMHDIVGVWRGEGSPGACPSRRHFKGGSALAQCRHLTKRNSTHVHAHWPPQHVHNCHLSYFRSAQCISFGLVSVKATRVNIITGAPELHSLKLLFGMRWWF